MRHYPTTEELARLLDEFTSDEQRALRAQLLDTTSKYDAARAAGRSLANAVRSALRAGDIANSSTAACRNALTQWESNDL